MKDRQADQVLLEGILAFVANHPNPDVRRFQESVANWGRKWRGAEAAHLPAVDYLQAALSNTNAQTHDLTALFHQAGARLRWEQSYNKAEGLVGEAMLAGYGFAEIIGQHGPFVSTRVRAGIGVWGPDIDYPLHRHQAEEIYVVLAGSARFQCGLGLSERKLAGDAIHIPSMTAHGFRSGEAPLVLFYIWQAGDLRENSTFV